LDYIKFVHHLLNVKNTEYLRKINTEKYDLRLFKSLGEMMTALGEKEKEHGLCRMMAGYSWKWVSRNSTKPDAVIEGIKLYWNRAPHDWINSQKAMNEIGCIHTTQGYDLNYAGIIFGKEIIFNKKTNQIDIRKEHYYDANGKAGIKDPEELKNYIINIYKTLMYRGIRGTFVYCQDKDLNEYFSNYVKRYG